MSETKELQKAWDKILALDQQLTVANGRLQDALETIDLLRSSIRQHATDLLQVIHAKA